MSLREMIAASQTPERLNTQTPRPPDAQAPTPLAVVTPRRLDAQKASRSDASPPKRSAVQTPERPGLPLQGTAKSKHPDFDKKTLYLRRETCKVAGRKYEDASGGDLSDLVEELLQKYLGGK